MSLSQSKLIIRPFLAQSEYSLSTVRPKISSERPKIAIVLSGGGARGLAQIGVLRVLERHKIPIDLIVGNSLGSVVGGLYASGYSTTEIESIAINTNWIDLLSFQEETKRTDLFVDQKQLQQEGYFSIRFDGLEPIIPSSISGGQRISNYFSYLTLQALYHPNPSFDDLKIPFRATATDLISGKRIVLDEGSLAEAMRASITVPLLYSPLEKDSMVMVDGGLVSNIPADVAKSLGCDVVIVVNSTSSMRNLDQMKAPWEIADQIMTIMMQESNTQQLKLADVVITPGGRERLVSDFSGLDTLIHEGEQAAEEAILSIFRAIKEKENIYSNFADTIFYGAIPEFEDDPLSDEIRSSIFRDCEKGSLSISRIEKHLNDIKATGKYDDVFTEVIDSVCPARVIYHAKIKMPIDQVHFIGNEIIPDSSINEVIEREKSRYQTNSEISNVLESILSLYRKEGYSLARIESLYVIPEQGLLKFKINEGKIFEIRYEGNEQTKSYIIRREFPLNVGDVFNIDEVVRGIVNIRSTGLFEYVLLDVRYENNQPIIVIKVKEKSSELIRVGFHSDNEHGIVSTVDIRDANFRGAWEDLGLIMRYGYRDRFARTEYSVNRIFHSYFTFKAKGYYKSRDIFTYQNDPPSVVERWERIEAGKYREIKYGGLFSFGSHFARLGDVTGELRWEKHRIQSLSGSGYDPEQYRFVSLKLQTIIDTEDKYSFPTKGIFLLLSFESATKQLGSERGFGKINAIYENYLTIQPYHTFRHKLTFGFADQTLPIAEQFHLGGLRSFMGLREDDSRGRQLFIVNTEYRFRFPFKLIFETYFKVRYDLGMISLIPEEIKFSKFHHGIGAEIAIDTPIGPASIAAGKSFYFQRGLPKSSAAVGPLLLYFSIGPSL
ncbi:MAG: patatin-like phospholipase family protein [Bacteroidota bacterium]|nr:patatin-like phospholipase family protein [Bacteroidota bacterium]